MMINLTNIILPSGQSSNGIICNNGAIQLRNYASEVHASDTYNLLEEQAILSHSTMSDILTANKDIAAMLPKVVESLQVQYGTEAVTPFKRISDVSNSFVEINEYNEVMAKHGINKRNFTTLHKISHDNSEMNRYLRNIFKVLHRHRGNPTLYWKLCFCLARRSNVFLALMLTEFDSNWHRNMSLKELHLLIYKLRTMWHTNPTDLAYRRCYIPKTVCPDTGIVMKHRPLGVPKVM